MSAYTVSKLSLICVGVCLSKTTRLDNIYINSLTQVIFKEYVPDENGWNYSGVKNAQTDSTDFVDECCPTHVEVGNFLDHPRIYIHYLSKTFSISASSMYKLKNAKLVSKLYFYQFTEMSSYENRQWTVCFNVEWG